MGKRRAKDLFVGQRPDDPHWGITYSEVSAAFRVKATLKRVLAKLAKATGLYKALGTAAPHGVFIFCYHRVIEEVSRELYMPLISISPGHMKRHLEFLDNRCTFVSMTEAVDILASGEPVDRDYAAITFDDGYRDNLVLGAPVFRQTNVCPTVYVVSDLAESGGVYWADEVRFILYLAPERFCGTVGAHNVDTTSRVARLRSARSLIKKLKAMSPWDRRGFLDDLKLNLGFDDQEVIDRSGLMLDWDEVRELLSSGVQIGSHTHNHEILTNLDKNSKVQQLEASKKLIEERTGTPCEHFAYPNGGKDDFSIQDARLIESCGYRTAASLVFGYNLPGCDPFQLKRITITRFDDQDDVEMKMFRARMAEIGPRH